MRTTRQRFADWRTAAAAIMELAFVLILTITLLRHIDEWQARAAMLAFAIIYPYLEQR